MAQTWAAASSNGAASSNRRRPAKQTRSIAPRSPEKAVSSRGPATCAAAVAQGGKERPAISGVPAPNGPGHALVQVLIGIQAGPAPESRPFSAPIRLATNLHRRGSSWQPDGRPARCRCRASALQGSSNGRLRWTGPGLDSQGRDSAQARSANRSRAAVLWPPGRVGLGFADKPTAGPQEVFLVDGLLAPHLCG